MFEVRLTKPIEELLPKSIDWNGAELMAIVKESLEKYRGKTYDDSSISEAKADRAALNNTVKMLDQMRLDVKKSWDAPYTAFKAEVDGITKEIGNVSETIDKQVKDYDARKQAEKRDLLVDYFVKKIEVGSLSEFVSFEKIENPRWMNSTFTMEKCTAEIDAKIEQIQNEIATIEALKSEDEAMLKAYYFRTLNLSGALMEHSRMQDDRKRIAAAKAAKEAAESARQAMLAAQQAKPATTPVAQEFIPVVPVPPAEQPQQPIEVPQRMCAVSFKVRGTESQITALRDFLNNNGINFEIIK